MVQLGDEVVHMSAPGRFRVVEIDGSVITIESDSGVRTRVLDGSVRVIEPRSS